MVTKRSFFILAIGVVFFSTSACDLLAGGSKIKGQVVDAVSGLPVSEAIVVATMKTDIEEDKKFEKKQTDTDNNGQFLIKGLSSKYTYTITVTKKGFSSNSIRVSPPEKGQTKLLEKQLAIALLPNEYGVFILENGKFEKIQPITFERITRCAGCLTGRNSYYYVRKTNFSTAVKIGHNNPTLVTFYPETIYWDSIDPLYYFKTKKFIFKYDTPKDNVRNDIYVAKAVSDKLAVLHTYKLSTYTKNFEPPSGYTFGGVGILEGKLPCSSYNWPNGNLLIVKIGYLRNGLYALRNRDKGWPFQIE